MSSVRAIIVDDESPARQYLRLLLERIGGVEIVGEAEEGGEFLKLVANNQPDVVFLDVRMPGVSGVELAQIVNRMQPSPSVVFVTGYDEYAVQAFDLAAVDFLTKPFSEDRLRKTIERIARGNGCEETHVRVETQSAPSVDLMHGKLPIKHRDGWKIVEIKEIIFARTEGRKVRVQTKSENYLCQYTLSELEQKLGDFGFFRANEGCLVNLSYVQEIVSYGPRNYELLISGTKNTLIPLSRSKAQKLRETLNLH